MKDTITYDDFLKLDIRVGSVLTIESVPKSKKLIKLEVSFGPEVGTRTILAGVAKDHADGRVAVGQKVIAVLNLAPRDMMGITSHGMLLASHDAEDRVFLLNIDNNISDGAEVG